MIKNDLSSLAAQILQLTKTAVDLAGGHSISRGGLVKNCTTGPRCLMKHSDPLLIMPDILDDIMFDFLVSTPGSCSSLLLDVVKIWSSFGRAGVEGRPPRLNMVPSPLGRCLFPVVVGMVL